ncbi:arsenate reductase (glutaredoxin) [Celeribacter sp.]|uniref:arsenate reductase (glutaredoxin) n=1 Tax=Celeribacter sp. TaxID=1890673 RepID=UPI003A8F69EF
MIKIYHNPRCSKSRQTLDILRKSGAEVEVIAYLDTPPRRDELAKIIAQAGETPRSVLRSMQKEAAEQGLTRESTDDEILDAMIAAPILINRPLVVTPKGARLCRPPERVYEILDVEKPVS